MGVLADVGLVGRNGQYAQFVNVEKFRRLGFRGAGHAREFLVQPEIILDGDGRQRLGFALDFNAFLGLNGLMQTVAPAAAAHEPAGVFIHNDDLVFLDDVFHVFLVKAVGLEQLRDGVDFLGFRFKILLQSGLGLHAFARIGFRPGINLVQQRRQIGQDKGFGVLGADDVAAFFGEIGLVTLFVNGKQQLLFFPVKIHLFLVPVQIQFGLVHQPQVFGVFQEFQQAFGFRVGRF